MAKLISSFELLVKPIAPTAPGSAGSNQTLVRAYFLLISNLNVHSEPEFAFKLKFTSGGRPLSSSKLLTIFDAGMGYVFDTLDATGKTGNLVLPSGFSGLFWLQPDLRKPDVLPAPPIPPNTEIRGYTEMEVSPDSSTSTAKLLVTPQQRGTIISAPTPPNFDRDIFCLPTANGGGAIAFP